MRSLANKIKSLRLKKKLSQQELAQLLNVSRQTISKWELDKSVPDLDYLINMSQLFDCSLDDLVGCSQKTGFFTKIGKEMDQFLLNRQLKRATNKEKQKELIDLLVNGTTFVITFQENEQLSVLTDYPLLAGLGNWKYFSQKLKRGVLKSYLTEDELKKQLSLVFERDTFSIKTGSETVFPFPLPPL